jgi:hypothetical protein
MQDIDANCRTQKNSEGILSDNVVLSRTKQKKQNKERRNKVSQMARPLVARPDPLVEQTEAHVLLFRLLLNLLQQLRHSQFGSMQ